MGDHRLRSAQLFYWPPQVLCIRWEAALLVWGGADCADPCSKVEKLSLNLHRSCSADRSSLCYFIVLIDEKTIVSQNKSTWVEELEQKWLPLSPLRSDAPRASFETLGVRAETAVHRSDQAGLYCSGNAFYTAPDRLLSHSFRVLSVLRF